MRIKLRFLKKHGGKMTKKNIYSCILALIFTANGFAGGKKKAKKVWERIKLSAEERGKCALLYEHAHYKGKEWAFCPGKKSPAGSDWNDKASSIRVPIGGKVKVCKHNHGGPCFSYFSDVPWVGHHLNDQISWIQYGEFDEDDFTMILMSDPQLYWKCSREDGQCIKKTGGKADKELGDQEKKQGKLSNQWHTASIKKLAASIPFKNFGGVISNGDLTAFGHSHELDAYKSYYETHGFKVNMYPGLGNHDYGKNNVDDCFRNACARRMVNYMTDRMQSFNPVAMDHKFKNYYKFPSKKHDHIGSLGYAFDIGNVRFVQLHNYPTYVKTFNGWDLKGFRETVYIKSSMDWVKKMVKDNPSKRFVFNWHDPWEHFDKNQQSKFADFCADRKCPVVFTGHYHHINGFSRYYKGKKQKIPVFLSGSASYNKYLKVRFQKDNITITAIDSENGGVKEYKDWHIKMNRPGSAYNGKP